ncbi:prostacyclin receptor [Notothenia coriiceps]|uniref:Thromboxane A2 receptor n=1 Tax=Notothenia coriiceps TaxID=8208 RepID=A0A6I9N417_9TELE|nr:PREDICTED: prostacyclin receptor-like [Notothenia coriiceps]
MNISMVLNESCNNTTCNDTRIVNEDGKPVTSIIMFLAAVVGNLLALFILGVHQKEHRSRSSVFCILVTGLALTDLLGTCLLSPPVFICYASNKSLITLGGAGLCNLFGFAMSFFGLAPTLILCTMAVERCLAISHPYFYSVHIRHSFAKFTLFFIYLFSLAFCLLPYSGYGKFRQYCPGTWCFIDMDATGDEKSSLVLAFSLSYSSLMALLICAVFVCNGSVIVSLCQMHRSQMMRRGSVGSAGRRRRMSLAWFVQGEEEVDHLVLLALITVIFVICSLPLTIAGFINAIHPFCGDTENLTAFRFYALNPIVDPWVFIICRKSVFRHLGSLLSCRFSKRAVKTTANCALSLPLDNHIQRNPPDVTDPQTNMYSGLPL